ncbi:alpha-L-fucosidase [Patella vulgata]|uniref:alpha-L-fucosidase n=1 Tax=Patella vulgata TaxID=6465 RepID=UPI0024A7D729|nr:alpha-L-fucosidase [Patella vulgata]
MLLSCTCLYSALLLLGCDYTSAVRYDPTWESIDSRPLPSWYDEAKLGIFIHWGVFSVPSISFPPYGMVAWFWTYWKGDKLQAFDNYMKANYRPDFTYADFAEQFTAEFYDANEWADIFNSSGAEYIVFTSKHHEGFTNWPSNHSFNWNSMAVGPKRDIVGELANAIKTKTSLHFGLYHSLFEWFHPLYLQDKANNFTTQNFVNTKTLPELYEIVNAYKPEVIWSDGDWEASSDYWKSTDFIAWLYNESPVKDTVVTNDRWGSDATCHHGGFLTCSDRYQPGVLQKRKWENAMTIDSIAWGFRRNAEIKDFLTTHQLITTFVETVSCGGNMLMNVGPTKEGRINPIFEERLRDMGAWLNVNNEAIKGSRPWSHQNDTLTPDIWYTMKDSAVYAVVLDWPMGTTLSLAAPMPQTNTVVTMLGYPGPFQWKARPSSGLDITILPIAANKLPCKWAWVLKFTNLENV